MGKRKIIDVNTEEKKKEVFDKFNDFTSKSQAHEYFGISDNKSGSDYLKEIAASVGFDLNLYKERKKKPNRYCKECGKEITSKWGKNFCCSACAAKYNNKHRDKSVYEKVAKKLKKETTYVYVPKKRYCVVCGKELNNSQGKYCSSQCRNLAKKEVKIKYKRICETCGKEFETFSKDARFCSVSCQAKSKHKEAYKDFLEHNEKYCRGNYTPKSFKRYSRRTRWNMPNM